MDLELLFRACWRHKLKLVAAALIGAIVVAGAGSLLLSPKYTSSAELAVQPILVDSGPQSPYVLNPDRYVATQIVALSSRQAAARAAKALDITPQQVADALAVSQIEKSDAIRVSATTTSDSLSAAIAQQVVDDYLADQAAAAKRIYDDKLQSIDDQSEALTAQIAAARKSITDAGQSAAGTGPLQTQLSNLVLQQSTLATARQDVLIQQKTTPSSATLVSDAAANPLSVGLSKKKLAIYGAALGLAVAFSIIAIANRPGQTLDDLDSADEFDGTPMLGVISASRRFTFPGLAPPPPIEDLRNMAVADELTNIVQLKGAVQFIVVGPPSDTRRIKKSLAPFVFGPTLPGEQNVENGPIHPRRRPADVGEFTVLSLATFLPGQLAPGYVVVGVDLGRVTRPQLEDVLSGLAGIGAEVLGIVGIR